MARSAVCLLALLAISSVVSARDTITLAEILTNSLFTSYTSALTASSCTAQLAALNTGVLECQNLPYIVIDVRGTSPQTPDTTCPSSCAAALNALGTSCETDLTRIFETTDSQVGTYTTTFFNNCENNQTSPSPPPSPVPSPSPVPVPSPAVSPSPVPSPVPAPLSPSPVPAPSPSPVPSPSPAVSPSPEPTPVPAPEPDFAPVPAPSEAPEPAVAPSPTVPVTSTPPPPSSALSSGPLLALVTVAAIVASLF